MPPDQHVNPAEEPSPASSPSRPGDPAADGTTFIPGVPRAPASRIRIQPQVTRIGRGTGNDIIVSALGVSKQHAELRRSPAGRYSIIDLGSHNGTFVNGTRVSQQELKEGDIIAIGHATFRLAGGKLTEYADDGAEPHAAAPWQAARTPVPSRAPVGADQLLGCGRSPHHLADGVPEAADARGR